MYCKECQYWNREDNNIGKCSSNKFIDISNQYIGCDDDGLDYDEREYNGDELLYSDMESYKANFYTGENFGCIHFKKREG